MATKVGRPKLDVIRDHTVTVRLSAEEHSRLKEYSEKHQKTITETIKEGIGLMYDTSISSFN